jgi:hypothetical protein
LAYFKIRLVADLIKVSLEQSSTMIEYFCS